MLKTVILLAILINVGSEFIQVYSSFWMPLFNRTVLNYRVDSKFDPEAAKSAREHYKINYGFRGEKLIADLGNGRGPSNDVSDSKVYGDVNFQYTYSEADNN